MIGRILRTTTGRWSSNRPNVEEVSPLDNKSNGINRQALLDMITEGSCPVCSRPEALLGGPSGGMSQNVMCKHCGTRLNVAIGFGSILSVDMTHGPQPEIWGGHKQDEFPDPVVVDEIKRCLEADE